MTTSETIVRPRARLLFICIFLGLSSFTSNGDWGFYAHRLINRMAVFTLPPEMMTLYKPHIDYLSEHAIDPDKRRYATTFEAIRHHIDLDAFERQLPIGWSEALLSQASIRFVGADTLIVPGWKCLSDTQKVNVYTNEADTFQVQAKPFRDFFRDSILTYYYSEDWRLPCPDMEGVIEPCVRWSAIEVVDSLSPKGILPYYLQQHFVKLRKAFLTFDQPRILQLSAEMGHYLADAHVPLHTTANYNGQLSNQVGIHAFWESRIPELFAESYDFLVGKAEYIGDTQTFFWTIVRESHDLVSEVLMTEKELSERFPGDAQFCLEERNQQLVRTPCQAYAAAYQAAMKGMVERRMRQSVQRLGSIWYTAWVDAGQPDLLRDNSIVLDQQTGEQPAKARKGRLKNRKHED